MNTAQRQHWEYQERRARENYWSHPRQAEELRQRAQEQLKKTQH